MAAMNTDRIKTLTEKVAKANKDYYNKTPTISDSEFDALKDELIKLTDGVVPKTKEEKKLIKKAQKTINQIGAVVGVTEWKKVKHSIPMGSLNKCNTPEELEKWWVECGSYELFMTEKLDGISVNTVWKDGVLVQAITRGDGEEGEDILANVSKMKGVPSQLKKPFSGSLRGEIIVKKSDFKQYFSDQSNARNTASGIAKRYDGTGAKHLTVLVYQAISDNKDEFKTELEQFKFLSSLGVSTPHYNIYSTASKATDEWKRYQKNVREKLDYEIDGLVVRVNKLSKQLELGERAHRPKGAIAFKFESPEANTILRKIIWQVGNTGRVTPVSEFDEVILLGAKINRASLHNYSNIKNLKLDIGAEIIISRANDVIPYVPKVTKTTGTIANYPKLCPSCNTNTRFNGEYLVCINKKTCPAQTIGRLKMWIKELNMLEFGNKILQKVIDANLVSDVADLYKLKVEDLAKLERMGEKSAKNLVDILNAHRDISLENFIGGLGIEGVATSTTKFIIDAGYDTLDAIMNLSIHELEKIDGFGTIRAEIFYIGLKENKDRIQNILNAGVKIKTKIKGKLTGKSFCFTGSMSTPRPQLHKLVETNGGNIKKNVGKGLQYLVIADPISTSSKAQAARKFGTKLISEKEFRDML